VIEIRRAGPADVDTVTGLLVAFRDWWGSTTPSDETFRATAARLLEDPNTEFLIAGDSGLAQLRYRLSVWTGTEDCWLEDLYVRDSARGTGLGRALTRASVERARARGCKRIELDVNETNTTAIALYTSSGFSIEPKPPGRTLFLGRRL
jgi:ribosomal protein S18 acetylase RimI-like enzyme